jgi:amidophosphoribosyltransferase
MAVSDGHQLTVLKDMGLVTAVFTERTMAGLSGDLAIGHTRYSTAGSRDWHRAQPIYAPPGPTGFAIAHNGNLTNTQALAAQAGLDPTALDSDTDLIATLLTTAYPAAGPAALEAALEAVLPTLAGAFSLVFIDGGSIYAVRDPNGFRPLCLGHLPATDDHPAGWAVASESPALDVIGASFVRELDPGELLVIDATGPHSLHPFDEARINPTLCIFEFVYFARPDAILYGHEVHGARRRMGQRLAAQDPVDADLVMGVPDSGIPAAEGYAQASRIPFGQGLVKNRYIGRTFITPTAAQRAADVRRKLNPLRENIAGKRLVVVDDSIVRGTTTRAMVTMLRDAGASQVHLRISSPPFAWPCFYGIDTPDRDELIAAHATPDQIATALAADSIAYLTLPNLKAAIAAPGAGFCTACITGEYPVPTPRPPLP